MFQDLNNVARRTFPDSLETKLEQLDIEAAIGGVLKKGFLNISRKVPVAEFFFLVNLQAHGLQLY